MTENVDHPAHYGGADDPFEAIKIIEALGLGEGFCLGNAIKYLVRSVHGKECRITDLRKAGWYIDRYIGQAQKGVGDVDGARSSAGAGHPENGRRDPRGLVGRTPTSGV